MINKTFAETLDQYTEQNRMYHFEGDSGLAKLEKIAEAIGYEKHGFLYGSPLEVFLSDNPGAQQALLEWISDNGTPEWQESLEAELEPEDDDEN